MLPSVRSILALGECRLPPACNDHFDGFLASFARGKCSVPGGRMPPAHTAFSIIRLFQRGTEGQFVPAIVGACAELVGFAVWQLEGAGVPSQGQEAHHPVEIVFIGEVGVPIPHRAMDVIFVIRPWIDGFRDGTVVVGDVCGMAELVGDGVADEPVHQGVGVSEDDRPHGIGLDMVVIEPVGIVDGGKHLRVDLVARGVVPTGFFHDGDVVDAGEAERDVIHFPGIVVAIAVWDTVEVVGTGL